MQILVTGHKGYIGSHFFDPLTMSGVDLKDNIDYGDLVDNEYDTVVHLAASVMVGESFLKPDEYFNNNCLKLARFIERNPRIRRFIFVSTGGALYGNKRMAKESDATWVNCRSPYAQSKYLGEMMVRDAIRDHVILRLANVYGGNSSTRGEAAVHAHFAVDNPIRVFGGDQTRDFIHVETVCTAIRRAIDSDVTGTFNLGSGVEKSIRELAEQYQWRGVPIIYEPAKTGEIEYVTLDCTKAKEAGLL
jgi:UDP-glucose 4-epimerase